MSKGCFWSPVVMHAFVMSTFVEMRSMEISSAYFFLFPTLLLGRLLSGRKQWNFKTLTGNSVYKGSVSSRLVQCILPCCYLSTLVDIHTGKFLQWCRQKLTFGIKGLKLESDVKKAYCSPYSISLILVAQTPQTSLWWCTQYHLQWGHLQWGHLQLPLVTAFVSSSIRLDACVPLRYSSQNELKHAH